MKISLERIDTRGVALALPGAGDQSIVLVSTTDLRGVLELEDATTRLSGFSVDELVLGAVRVLLGELVLSSPSGTCLRQLAVELQQTRGATTADTTAVSLTTEELRVEIHDVVVRGRMHLGGVHLRVDGDHGSLSAERVEVGGFSLRLGEVAISTDTARAESVAIAWAPDVFRLAAGSIESAAMTVVIPDGRLLASDVAVDALVVANGDVAIGRLRAGGTRVDLRTKPAATSVPAKREKPPATATATAHEPLIDLRILDALHGQLDVDVDVDITVPIIGHRQAVHRFRIAIDQGKVDYRALEKNLSTLEEALLDFAVRDGALVIERLNPLHPTRGRGKPVVVWHLEPADLELAHSNLVRLAVLSKPTLPGGDDRNATSAPSAKASAFALRHLVLRGIDAHLALGATPNALGGQLRVKRLDSIHVNGDVSHDPGTPAPPGLIRGDVGPFALQVHRFPLGASALDIEQIVGASITALELTFADATPIEFHFDITGLTLDAVRLGR